MAGNAFVVPAARPNAIVNSVLPVRSDSAVAARYSSMTLFLHGLNTPAYDLRARVTAGIPLAAGDLVKVQVQRVSTFARRCMPVPSSPYSDPRDNAPDLIALSGEIGGFFVDA